MRSSLLGEAVKAHHPPRRLGSPKSLEIADMERFVGDVLGSPETSTTTAQPNLVEYWTSRGESPDIEFCKESEVHEIMRAMTLYSERSGARSRLYKTIQSGKFFDLTDENIIQQICEEFPLEFDQLKTIPGNQPYLTGSSVPESLSRSLLKKDHNETNSTLKSILALRWLQKQPTRRDWPFAYERGYIYTLVVLLIAINLAKDPRILANCCDKTGTSREGVRYNAILLGELRGECPDMIKCWRRLNCGALREISEALQLDLEDLPHLEGGIPVVRLGVMAQTLEYTGGIRDRTFDEIFLMPTMQRYHEIYRPWYGYCNWEYTHPKAPILA